MDVFSELARCVSASWRSVGFKASALPDVAARALAEINPASQPRQALIELALARLNRGQHRACFHTADNVIPVYADDQFILTFHLWTHTFGNPHSHRWNGAFQNLTDPVVYADYTFDEAEAFNYELQFGELTQSSLRVLRPGEIIPVERLRTIHGFGHTGLPGLTVAVRSRNVYGKTYDYWGTGVRVTNEPDDEIFHDAMLRSRALRMLLLCSEERFAEKLEHAFQRGSLRSGFVLALDLVTRLPAQRDALSRSLVTALELGPRHERWVTTALRDRLFHSQALSLLEQSVDPRHRFLVSLLRFAPTRAEFDRLLDDPGAALFSIDGDSFARDMCEIVSTAGRSYLQGSDKIKAVTLEVFELMLGGASKSDIVAELGKTFRAASLDQTVDLLMRSIRDMPLFHVLFADLEE